MNVAPQPHDPKRPGEEKGGLFGRKSSETRSNLVWIGVGVELGGAIAILALLGHLVDNWLHSDPWGLIVGAMIGIVGGLYNLVKEVIKANR